jgi:hypothetical protein
MSPSSTSTRHRSDHLSPNVPHDDPATLTSSTRPRPPIPRLPLLDVHRPAQSQTSLDPSTISYTNKSRPNISSSARPLPPMERFPDEYPSKTFCGPPRETHPSAPRGQMSTLRSTLPPNRIIPRNPNHTLSPLPNPPFQHHRAHPQTRSQTTTIPSPHSLRKCTILDYRTSSNHNRLSTPRRPTKWPNLYKPHSCRKDSSPNAIDPIPQAHRYPLCTCQIHPANDPSAEPLASSL